MISFQTDFLIRKIRQIGTGLFYNCSEGLMKTPVDIIQIRYTDQKGNIYFDIPRPYSDMSGVDKKFFSKIQFFNPSCKKHVMAEGYATIVDDQPEFENIFIQFHLSEASCLIHRKTKLKGFSGRIQHLTTLLFKGYYKEQPWAPLPAY